MEQANDISWSPFVFLHPLLSTSHRCDEKSVEKWPSVARGWNYKGILDAVIIKSTLSSLSCSVNYLITMMRIISKGMIFPNIWFSWDVLQLVFSLNYVSQFSQSSSACVFMSSATSCVDVYEGYYHNYRPRCSSRSEYWCICHRRRHPFSPLYPIKSAFFPMSH